MVLSEYLMSRPARALWIEMVLSTDWKAGLHRSRPARALWIEIILVVAYAFSPSVEAREGLVD